MSTLHLPQILTGDIRNSSLFGTEFMVSTNKYRIVVQKGFCV